ncbi:hypothetical protein QF028_002469 [Neobacillus sp. B4I6]
MFKPHFHSLQECCPVSHPCSAKIGAAPQRMKMDYAVDTVLMAGEEGR